MSRTTLMIALAAAVVVGAGAAVTWILTERDTGRLTWTAARLDGIPAGTRFDSIGCARSACWVGGESGARQMFLGRLDGRTLTAAPVPADDEGSDGAVASVDCSGASDCWAARTQSPTNGEATYEALHYDGTRWQLLPAAPAAPALGCQPEGPCWVADHDVLYGVRDGRWTAEPAAGQVTTGSARVACRGAGDCVLLQPGSHLRHFDGYGWRPREAPPLPDRSGDALLRPDPRTLSCPHDCWLAANAERLDGPGGVTAVLLHLDAAGWHVITPGTDGLPALAGGADLDCPAADSCFLFGVTEKGAPAGKLFHWNGKRWRSVRVPGQLPSSAALACASAAFCALAGNGTVTVGM